MRFNGSATFGSTLYYTNLKKKPQMQEAQKGAKEQEENSVQCQNKVSLIIYFLQWQKEIGQCFLKVKFDTSTLGMLELHTAKIFFSLQCRTKPHF